MNEIYRTLLIPLVFLCLVQFSPAEASDHINRAELTGTWGDPDHNGEGFVLQVLEDERAVVYWFTYDALGRQRWFIGVGAFDGNELTFPNLLQSTRLATDSEPVLTKVGTAKFLFSDCNSARVEYTVEEFESFQATRRITGIAGHDCSGTPRTSSSLISGLSGAWVETGLDGEGFVVQVYAPDKVVVFWFTYDENGNQAWQFGTGKVSQSVLRIDGLLSTNGPSFGADYNVADLHLVDWGSLEIQLDCQTLDYDFQALSTDSRAGQIAQLTRVCNTRCSGVNQLHSQLDQMMAASVNAENFEIGASFALESSVLGTSWQGVVGQSSLDGPDLTGDHAFWTNSLGTFFTATLALQLVEQDVLDLDLPISNYLPVNELSGLVMFDGVDHSASVTLRHLLSHRSGLPPLTRPPRSDGTASFLDQLLANFSRIWTPEEVMDYARFNLDAISIPGLDPSFNEFNYIVIARVIETATGQSLDGAFRQWVSGPAGMNHTWSFSREEAPPGLTLAASHIAETDVNAIPSLSALTIGSDWITTQDDLGRFLHFLFEGSLFSSDETLPQLIAPDWGLLGVARMGLGGMTRSNDCALPDARLQGFMGGGAFAFFVPEHKAYLYGFTSRQDYFALGYISDLLQSAFGSSVCTDSGAWPVADNPEAAGFSSTGLVNVEELLQASDASAFLAVSEGSVAFQYGQIGRRYAAHSIRKSLVGSLFGGEVESGRLNLDSTVQELGINDKSPLLPLERQATLRQLLQSRSGIYHPAAGDGDALGVNGPGVPRGVTQPGTVYFYNNWDFNAAATILEQATGESVFDQFIREIGTPIGMEDIRRQDQIYLFEREESVHPVYWFTLTARDLARFGQLYLQNGVWEGEQVISSNWVAESTTNYSDTGHPTRPGFGYMNWSILDQGYMASGSGGHKLLVVPDENLVFVLRVDTYNEGRHVSDNDFFAIVAAFRAARL